MFFPAVAVNHNSDYEEEEEEDGDYNKQPDVFVVVDGLSCKKRKRIKTYFTIQNQLQCPLMAV